MIKIISDKFHTLFTLGFFKVADAHVTLNPKAVDPESYEKVDVRVPVEQKIVLKVELEVPKEVQVVNIQPVEGYKYKLDKDKKVTLLKLFGLLEVKALDQMNLWIFQLL